ncbi:hypothetical protein [Rhizorhabdus dicambivorans]|uniref:Uncharacterized protein n=1 Tax=Rhizorhabdus dicambivorans TaxID=1850238 RepID=A0A2A4FW57_9SPHN|nr:hypothetical protein [Rhizorhabdus dicambivorans]ATE67364.1 hypothetical protein CMV14_14870 [Rhizorhabdus dicambivorans]PCE41960.1 hypothetical protein COO09_12625 [Rhizorhabdus dicambivorans]
MSEPKPVASLTSSLLARKGDARPAIRRAYVPMASLGAARDALHEDLGWGEGQRTAPRAPEPALPVREQQERLSRSFTVTPEKAEHPPAPSRAAFTLRLDADRHLRLRLASAAAHRSAQQLVTEALDRFLRDQPCLDALADQVRASRRPG